MPQVLEQSMFLFYTGNILFVLSQWGAKGGTLFAACEEVSWGDVTPMDKIHQAHSNNNSKKSFDSPYWKTKV